MTHLKGLILGVAAAVAAAQGVGAATATGSVSASVTVSAMAKLTLSSATVTFANADPDTSPSIAASEGAVTITAKGKTSTGGTIALTLLAADDLRSGGDRIPISNITWTATGSGFAAGTMSKAAAQPVGSWTNSGSRTGTQRFALVNSWSYAAGSYTTTATYTLTAP
jgi:hypothetical protein